MSLDSYWLSQFVVELLGKERFRRDDAESTLSNWVSCSDSRFSFESFAGCVAFEFITVLEASLETILDVRACEDASDREAVVHDVVSVTSARDSTVDPKHHDDISAASRRTVLKVLSKAIPLSPGGAPVLHNATVGTSMADLVGLALFKYKPHDWQSEVFTESQRSNWRSPVLTLRALDPFGITIKNLNSFMPGGGTFFTQACHLGGLVVHHPTHLTTAHGSSNVFELLFNVRNHTLGVSSNFVLGQENFSGHFADDRLGDC